MDSTLNFDLHIRKKCQAANHQLHNLKNIRQHLSQKSAEVLVHGLVHSQLDFRNSLFAELPSKYIDKHQKTQNRAARVVTQSKFDQSAKPMLKKLQWLPVKARVIFKIVVLVFKCLQGSAPSYLRNMVEIEQPKYSLTWSAAGILLSVPATRTKMCDRSFHVAGPKLWNSLPSDIRSLSSECVFRQRLKTHLFSQFLSDV